jgi:hypothetical protein
MSPAALVLVAVIVGAIVVFSVSTIAAVAVRMVNDRFSRKRVNQIGRN